jgi:hypothetical protein
MALLAVTNAADPAAAQVTGAGAAPASSGGAQQWVSFYFTVAVVRGGIEPPAFAFQEALRVQVNPPSAI